MGSVISVFDDFMESTESAYLTSPNEVINEVVRNTYALGYMLKSGDQAITLQSGKSIKWLSQMVDAQTAHFYLPDDNETPSQPQTMTDFEVGWRFFRDNMAWNNETITLNASGMDPNGRRTQIVGLKRQLEQAMWTSKFNKMEDALFSTPNQADMETAGTAKVPYSLGVWNNELTNTIPYTGLGSTTAWGTVAGKNPASFSRFRNQRATYNGASTGAVVGSTAPHLFTAFRRMLNQTGFDRLPEKPEYSQKKSMPTRILTSLSYGTVQYEFALQSNNDWLRYAGGQDPAYPNPTFQGIPIEGIAALDTAVMYPTGSGGIYAAENDTAGTNNAGPRYHFLNFEYLKPVFHTEMYLYRHPVMTHPNQPSTHVMYVDTYYNIVCTSRQRQGIVYPATADSVFI
jgi:hypothetical protein